MWHWTWIGEDGKLTWVKWLWVWDDRVWSDLPILFDNIIGTNILALFWPKSQNYYWYCYCLNFHILKLQFCCSFAIVGLQNSKYWVVQSIFLVLYWYCKFAFFHLSKLKLMNFLMNYANYWRKTLILEFTWPIWWKYNTY